MPNHHMVQVIMTVKGLKHSMLLCLYEADIATALGEDLVTNVALSFVSCYIFHTNWQQYFK